MKTNRFCTALASLLLFSCSVENELGHSTEDDITASYTVTQEEAQIIVQSLLDEISFVSSTKGTENNLREISGINVLRRNTIQTRSGTDEIPADLDTLMYVVNFSDDNGFALVAADKRTEPVFAIIDKGNFDFGQLNEEDNDMFLTFLDYAISTELEDIENYGKDEPQTKAAINGWTINTTYAPILKTNWAQGDRRNPYSSYGKYCPNFITGCAVTAAAQILSHFRNISHVDWSYNGTGGGADLHWDRIISDCEKYNGMLDLGYTAQSLDEIAHLCRYLGLAFDAEYEEKTNVKRNKPINWFNDWSGLKASKLEEYNDSQIISSIKNGNPVYGTGFSGRKRFLGITIKHTGGHVWVYDGYISANKDGKQQNLIHCNWGWGGNKNGYYLSKVFDTNSGPEIPDYQITDPTETSYYKYKLEYSIISR